MNVMQQMTLLLINSGLLFIHGVPAVVISAPCTVQAKALTDGLMPSHRNGALQL